MNFSHTAAHPYEFLIQNHPYEFFIQSRSPVWISVAIECDFWVMVAMKHVKEKQIRFGNMGLSVTWENQLQCYITVPWLGYRLKGPALESRKGQQIPFSPKHPDRLWVPSSLPGEYRGSLPEVKRPGHEVNHAPPMSRIRLSAAYGGTTFFYYSTRDLTHCCFLSRYLIAEPDALILFPEDGGSRLFQALVLVYQTTRRHFT